MPGELFVIRNAGNTATHAEGPDWVSITTDIEAIHFLIHPFPSISVSSLMPNSTGSMVGSLEFCCGKLGSRLIMASWRWRSGRKRSTSDNKIETGGIKTVMRGGFYLRSLGSLRKDRQGGTLTKMDKVLPGWGEKLAWQSCWHQALSCCFICSLYLTNR